MSEPCVIRADYSNWRTVAGRKVLQLVFEIPIEQTAEVMSKLGVPMPGESKWCAIALLDTNLARTGENVQSPATLAKPNADRVEPQKQRKPFASLPLSAQAALRCQDENFKWFLMDEHPEESSKYSEAAEVVRSICRVGSRSELDKGGPSAGIWAALEKHYQRYLTDKRYSDQVR